MIDADCAISLDITMSPYGAGSCAGLTDCALHQKQVDTFMDIVDAILMLRQTHRPADDNPFCGL